MKKKKFDLPFKHLTNDNWINLAITATLIFYIIQIGVFISYGDLCHHFGFDYCAFWTAGKIINEHSIADVYNLNLLGEYQGNIFPQSDHPLFKPAAVMYPPIFLLPFQLLSLVDLPYSFLLWTIINFAALIFYLRFFTKKLVGHPLSFKLLSLLLISLPVFINFLEGQVNVWLLICAGEFIRAFLSDKPITAGLWLGGWTLKPQLLLLIIPFLLTQRLIKTLSGLFTSSIAITLLSLGLLNKQSLLNIINILKDAGRGGVGSNPAVMMNWRMIGWHIDPLTSLSFAGFVAIIGAILTASISFLIFRKKVTSNSNKFTFALLGIIAATNVVTWHAHIHMSIIIIPLMIYLIMKNCFDNRLFIAWAFVPIFFQFIGYISVYFLQIQNLPEISARVFKLTRGLPGFLLNLILLGWAIFQYNISEEISFNNQSKQ